MKRGALEPQTFKIPYRIRVSLAGVTPVNPFSTGTHVYREFCVLDDIIDVIKGVWRLEDKYPHEYLKVYKKNKQNVYEMCPSTRKCE